MILDVLVLSAVLFVCAFPRAADRVFAAAVGLVVWWGGRP